MTPVNRVTHMRVRAFVSVRVHKIQDTEIHSDKHLCSATRGPKTPQGTFNLRQIPALVSVLIYTYIDPHVSSSLHASKMTCANTSHHLFNGNDEELHALLLILCFPTSFLSCNMRAL